MRSTVKAPVADLKGLLNPPSEASRSSILEALREDEGRLEHNLKLLETWLSCQSHLPKNFDKNLLVIFLRSCKHDLQRAKKKLEYYCMARTLDDVLYGNRELTEEHDIKSTSYNYICPLPELTDEGYRITVRGLLTDADSCYDFNSILRYDLRISDLRFHCETLTAGDVYVFSGKHVTSTIISRFFSAEFSRQVKMTQTSFPTRLRQAHVVHVNPAVVKCVNLIKFILPDKLKQRVFIHSDLESLYKAIPRRLLPSDLGGEQKSCREINEAWMKKVMESKEWFRELDGLKVTGSVPKQFEQELYDQYGAEGSFRKLNID